MAETDKLGCQDRFTEEYDVFPRGLVPHARPLAVLFRIMRVVAFGRRKPWLLLVATLASLLSTILAGYLTLSPLIDASLWITHTDEVKLAIADCQRALDRGDPEALRAGLARVERITLDNPHQQRNVARAGLLAEQGQRLALDDLLESMQVQETHLRIERVEREATARTRSFVAFVVAAVLTLVFGGGAFLMLREQRRQNARQRALLEEIIEGVDEGIIAVSPSRQIIAINQVARAMWGGSSPRSSWPEDWRPTLRTTYEDGSQMDPAQGPLARALRGETTKNVVYRVTLASDEGSAAGVWVSASARPIQDEDGRTIAAVTTLRDITEQRAHAERLRDESLTDPLTGLLNRRGFLSAAEARIAEGRRTKVPMALLYADVNGLKRINDTLGHEQGDRVIEDAARALRSVFRERDIVARIGGDEFVALLPNLSLAAREPLLGRLEAAILAHEQEGRPFRLSMSSAITFMDWEKDTSLDELLADADRKMYAQKRERAGQSLPVLRATRPSRI